jgi:hypothetical protein
VTTLLLRYPGERTALTPQPRAARFAAQRRQVAALEYCVDVIDPRSDRAVRRGSNFSLGVASRSSARVESCGLGLVPFDVGCAVFVDLDCEALVV